MDGKKALFHRWADKGKMALMIKSVLPAKEFEKQLNCIVNTKDLLITDNKADVIQMQCTYGIVEFADGRVSEVEPSKIRFTDNMVNKTLNTVAEKLKE